MKIDKTILGLFILLGLCSCEKEEIIPRGIYLSKVIYHQNIDQIRHYHYNKQGLLSKREFQLDSKIQERFDYKYQEGLMNSIDYYEYINGMMIKNYALLEYQFGNIMKSTLYSFYSKKYSTSTYEYDNDNRVTRVISSLQSFEFLYDDKDNIREITIYDHLNSTYNGKLIYEYDTKRNPFYNLDPIHDGYFSSEIDFISYKSPNNPVKRISISSENDTLTISEFFYKYNENNLPVESEEVLNSKYYGYDHIETINHRLYVYERQ